MCDLHDDANAAVRRENRLTVDRSLHDDFKVFREGHLARNMALARLFFTDTIFGISVNPQTVSSLKTVWGYIGPLVGVCLGAFLGWHMQRSHWRADNRKREFQELLTALMRGHIAICRILPPGAMVWSREEMRGFNDDIQGVDIAMEDRVFIGDEVRKLDLKGRWDRAMGGFRATHHLQTFEREFEKIKEDIIKAAQG